MQYFLCSGHGVGGVGRESGTVTGVVHCIAQVLLAGVQNPRGVPLRTPSQTCGHSEVPAHAGFPVQWTWSGWGWEGVKNKDNCRALHSQRVAWHHSNMGARRPPNKTKSNVLRLTTACVWMGVQEEMPWWRCQPAPPACRVGLPIPPSIEVAAVCVILSAPWGLSSPVHFSGQAGVCLRTHLRHRKGFDADAC